MSNLSQIMRAKRIIEARATNPADAVNIEQSIALELLGAAVMRRDIDVRHLTYPQHGYLSPMEATECFAAELQDGLTHLARGLNLKAPKAETYNPLVATPTILGEVWRARQAVDELGIPYGFYVGYAIVRWHELGNKRMPRPLQLVTPDIVMHVMRLWADPAFRWQHAVLDEWDVRFECDQYCDDPLQDRALALLEQRVEDAKFLGYEPANVLVGHLDLHIAEDDARARFGDVLVDKALELKAVSIAANTYVEQGSEAAESESLNDL